MIAELYKFVLIFGFTFLALQLLPSSFRWTALLFSSYWLFINCDPGYWWLVPALSLLIYVTGLLLAGSHCTENQKLRRCVFFAGVFLTLTPLLGFKYSAFLAQDGLWSARKIILPLGISFYTFQAVAYLNDVYKKRITAYRHPGMVALYVAFFPHLLAGPIVRAEDLIPQLMNPKKVTLDDGLSGTRLIFFGLFKKFAVSTHLEIFANTIHASPEFFHGFPLLLAAVLFRYQLYFDLSGYSDIAVGASRIFGITLPKNFNNPFASTSPGDHWRRWHLTLVSWFRDLVYMPLCRLMPSRSGIAAAVLLTLACVGLWHGASWNWILFGLINGVFLIIDSVSKPWRVRLVSRLHIERYPGVLKVFSVVTTFILMLIPVIAGRSDTPARFLSNLQSAFLIRRDYLNLSAFEAYFNTGESSFLFFSAIALTVGVEMLNYLLSDESEGSLRKNWLEYSLAVRAPIYAVAALLFIAFGNMEKFHFYYFDF